jgi:hypothetical protein
MKITDKCHRYSLDQIDQSTKQIHGEKQDLQFLNTEDGRQTHGVTTQEVIRALIGPHLVLQ